MPAIELTKEEIEHIQNCLGLATAVSLNLPDALKADLMQTIAPHVLQGIKDGHHRHVIEKIAPEKAATVEKILAQLKGEFNAH